MPRPKKVATKNINGLGTVWQQPNGRWRWQVTLGYDSNGKRMAKSGTESNKTLAEKALSMAVSDHQRGSIAAPDKITVGEWLEKWLNNRKPRIRPNTARFYETLIEHISPKKQGTLIPNFAKKRLQEVKPKDLREFYDFLNIKHLNHPEHYSKPIGARTLKGIHGVLQDAFTEAVKLELVTRNITHVIKPEIPKQDNNVRASQAWTGTEAAAFLAVARGDRLYAMFYLLLCLGLRRGEVCGLRWSNIDLEKRTVSIEETLICINGEPVSSLPKTRNSKRVLRLPQDAVDTLKIHQAMQNQMHQDNSVQPSRNWVFTTSTGEAFHPESVKHVLNRLIRAAGVRQIRTHDLRHTYASLARRAGVPLEVVSEKLGHHKPSFTADVYRHTYADEHEEAALELHTLLSGRVLPQA